MEKFLFNNNIFDGEDGIPEPEQDVQAEEEQPDELNLPPMFTLEELEAEKKRAFEEGKSLGQAEVSASLEKKASDALGNILSNIEKLANDSNQRHEESVDQLLSLVPALISAAFPIVQEKYGFEELRDSILKILNTYAPQEEINIKVHPDILPLITEYFAKSATSDLKVNLNADLDISHHECRIAWQDGGAVYNQDKMIENIISEVKNTFGMSPALKTEENSDIMNQTADSDQESDI